MSTDKTQVGGDHYLKMDPQPWEVMQLMVPPVEYIGYLKCNIIKYSMRQGRKEGSDDSGKAKHYIEELRRFVGMLNAQALAERTAAAQSVEPDKVRQLA